jgi:peptidoglycan hydrolase CwlO-like protein
MASRKSPSTPEWQVILEKIESLRVSIQEVGAEVHELRTKVQENSSVIRELTTRMDALTRLEERVAALEKRTA